MANAIVRLPLGYFPDPNKGRPLGNAKIYVGIADLDPRILANQLPVFGRQESGVEVPIAQPVRTSFGGVPVDDNGNIVTLLVDGAYAMAVDDSKDDQKYYFANVMDGEPLTLLSGVSSVDTIALLRDFEPIQDGQQVSLLGHTLAGIGGGEFYFDESDITSVDNNGTIIVTASGKRWKRELSGFVSPEMYGATGAPANDTSSIQASWDNEHLFKVNMGARTYNHTGLIVPNGSIIQGKGKTQTILNNTDASSTSVLIPYFDDLNFFTKILLSNLTILAGVNRSGTQIGLDLDTAMMNKFESIVVSGHSINIREKSSWSNLFDTVQSFDGTDMWKVIPGDSTNGTPNTHINCDGEACDNGISVDIRGHSASVWIGGAIEHMQNYAVKIFGNDDRAISFIGVNFEGNQQSTAGASGADIILGDAGATTAPTNIKFDCCQFTQTYVTQTRPAFDLIRGGNLTLDTCHFIGYPEVATLSSNFGSFNLRQLGGISKFSDSTNANTEIPASGIIQGNRLSVSQDTNGKRIVLQDGNTNNILESRRYTESHKRFEITAGGIIGWHPFNSEFADVELSRKAAGAVGVSGSQALSTGSGTTEERPFASVIGSGSMWLDTTINKPIWSNGSIWIDATGTGV